MEQAVESGLSQIKPKLRAQASSAGGAESAGSVPGSMWRGPVRHVELPHFLSQDTELQEAVGLLVSRTVHWRSISRQLATAKGHSLFF